MTLQKIANTAVRGQCQDDVVDQILGETPSLGNFFAAAPPSNPSPVDDARVARAEWWLINDCPDAGDDRFASAVDAATVLRDTFGLPSTAAETTLCDIWNRVAVEPPLTPSQITEAVRQAYCWQATPPPSTAAEQAEQTDDVSPASPILGTTTPSA